MNLRRQRAALDEAQAAHSGWLVTFSDLLTLLLTMFVMRYAMSTISSTALQDTIGAADRKLPADTTPGTTPASQLTESLSMSLGSELIASFGDNSDAPVLWRIENDQVVLVLSGTYFLSESDELSFRGKELLSSLTKSVSDRVGAVRIAAYTEEDPPSSAEYPSPWELSRAQALAVARQMIDAGLPESVISAAGLADTRPLFNGRGITATYRNRRVELFLTPLAPVRFGD